MFIQRLCLLACFVVPSAVGQTAPPPPPTYGVFRSSLVRMQKDQIAEWRQSLQQIQIEKLPIGYAHGKLIEQTRDQALQWLQICNAYASHALQTQALGDYVNLASSLSELFHRMQDVSSILETVDFPNGAAEDLKNRWAQRVMDLAGGPINGLSQ